jgi:hypothetical protein
MYTLGLLPSSDGYNVEDAIDTAIITMLDGGGPRVRAAHAGNVKLVTCQWVLNPADHDALWAFYRTATACGANPFKIPLVGVDSATLTTYVAWFVPRTFKLAGQKGQQYTISAQMYALPNIINPAADLALFSSWG